MVVVGIACTPAENPTAETPPTNAPVVRSAAPLPPMAPEAVDQFEEQHRLNKQARDQFHSEFDNWRAGLDTCDAVSARQAFEDFAADFNSITALARNLPGTAATREFADLVVNSTEEEAKALRGLRDHWQPNNPASRELVETRRSDAGVAQQQAGDMATDLLRNSGSGSAATETAASAGFAESFGGIKKTWESFHADYASQGGLEESDDPDETLEQFDKLIDRFADMIEESDQALDATATTNADAGSRAEREAAASQFGSQLSTLRAEWNAFHQRYDDWWQKEGGCDRESVHRDLGQFRLRSSELSRAVRDLPQSSYLLPIYNLLTEAAAREEASIRTLTNSWQPFAIDPFKPADQERVIAERLRRQATITLQELRERY